jgi:hypothetical protein
VTDKRPSPAGQPDKFELTLKLVLPRVVAERLTARAIREGRKLEALSFRRSSKARPSSSPRDAQHRHLTRTSHPPRA